MLNTWYKRSILLLSISSLTLLIVITVYMTAYGINPFLVTPFLFGVGCMLSGVTVLLIGESLYGNES